MKNRFFSRTAVCFGVLAILAACQSGNGSRPAGSGKSAALQTMEQIAISAHRCWFAGNDPAFRQYRFADELNSYSGRPRFLLVPAKRPEERPLLVVQAEGSPARLQAFGPLMEGPLATRINADIKRWNGGDRSCASHA